jgi:carboxymethylenebutenolidase
MFRRAIFKRRLSVGRGPGMAMGREGSEIEFSTTEGASDARTISAYLAKPMTVLATTSGSRSTTGRGILVVHEDWGLTDSIRDRCDRLARAGFVALAPDLFHGPSAVDPVRAAQLAKELDLDLAAQHLGAAVEELTRQDAVEGAKLGVLGFGIGGYLALLAASRDRRIGAVASFYAAHSGAPLDLTGLEASVLAIFAGDEEADAESAIRCLEAAIRETGVRNHIKTRTDVKRGYMNDSWRGVYHAVAAAEGWDALLALFRAELT